MAEINFLLKKIIFRILYWGHPDFTGLRENIYHILNKFNPDVNYNYQQKEIIEGKWLFKKRSFETIDPLTKEQYFEHELKHMPKIGEKYSVSAKIYFSKETFTYSRANRQRYLYGCDGICLVVDSAKENLGKSKENISQLLDTIEDYKEKYSRENKPFPEIPVIIQYNNRSKPNALSIKSLNEEINKNNYPWMEADSKNGAGVFETYEKLCKIVFDDFEKKRKTLLYKKLIEDKSIRTSSSPESKPTTFAVTIPDIPRPEVQPILLKPTRLKKEKGAFKNDNKEPHSLEIIDNEDHYMIITNERSYILAKGRRDEALKYLIDLLKHPDRKKGVKAYQICPPSPVKSQTLSENNMAYFNLSIKTNNKLKELKELKKAYKEAGDYTKAREIEEEIALNKQSRNMTCFKGKEEDGKTNNELIQNKVSIGINKRIMNETKMNMEVKKFLKKYYKYSDKRKLYFFKY